MQKSPSGVRVKLTQPVLLYFDPATGERGTQFGVPPLSRRGAGRHLASVAKMDIVLFPDDAEPRRVPHPVLTIPHLTDTETTEPPRPFWAWVHIELEERVVYARVVPPREMKGSMPLSVVSTRYCPVLAAALPLVCTPDGLDRFALEPSLFDFNANVELEAFHDEEILPLETGCHLLALCHIERGRLLAFEPTEVAARSGLWTTHLLRLFEVQYCRAEPLRGD